MSFVVIMMNLFQLFINSSNENKKIFKIIGWGLASILFILIALFAFFKYYFFYKFPEDTVKYANYIGYIDQEKALLNKTHNLCDNERIFYVYNGAALKAFEVSKKQFRNTIVSEFKNNDYTDYGYLTFRFLINCEGKAGWFEIIEMNLDLEETSLNDNLVSTLFKLTSNEKHWKQLNFHEEPIDYYMYISYRIENGKITEILP